MKRFALAALLAAACLLPALARSAAAEPLTKPLGAHQGRSAHAAQTAVAAHHRRRHRRHRAHHPVHHRRHRRHHHA